MSKYTRYMERSGGRFVEALRLPEPPMWLMIIVVLVAIAMIAYGISLGYH